MTRSRSRNIYIMTRSRSRNIYIMTRSRSRNIYIMTRSRSRNIYIMTRSRSRNRYLRLPSQENKVTYKIQRNVCTKLLRKRKRSYYSKLGTKYICDNKKFWNTVKPLFSDKINASHKIFLIDENNIIFESKEIAEIFNDFLVQQQQILIKAKYTLLKSQV